MADIADLAEAQNTPIVDAAVELIRQRATAIPVGEPGDCNLCGENFARLVQGNCARCRDSHHLP